jgi:sugar phosphate isomerase/epimerase
VTVRQAGYYRLPDKQAIIEWKIGKGGIMDATRRGFLGGAMAAGFTPAYSPAETSMPADSLKIGLASYSLRGFNRKLAILRMKQLPTKLINIKDVHLALTTSATDMEKARKEFDKAGLVILGGGTVDFKKDDEADFRRKFEYAKKAGMPLMVAAPTAETLPKLEKYVKEYDIKIAVHNHGPEDKHFPTPDSVLKIVRNLDPRIGLCMDIGHTARTGGNVVDAIKAAGPRLLDMHFKDLTVFEDTKDLKAKDAQVPVGRGKMPVLAIFRELKRMNYQGGIMLEYEAQEEDPMPGIFESLGFMRAAVAALSA